MDRMVDQIIGNVDALCMVTLDRGDSEVEKARHLERCRPPLYILILAIKWDNFIPF